MSLPDVVRACQETSEQTQPTFLLTDPNSEDEGETSTGSVKSLFSYYDTECQLVFEEGKIEPIQVTNYISPPISSRNGAEVNLPQIEQFRPSCSRSRLRMQFTLESTKGDAVWISRLGKSRWTHLGNLKRTRSDVVRRAVVIYTGQPTSREKRNRGCFNNLTS